MSTNTKVVDRAYLTKQFKNYNDTLVKPGLEDLEDKKVDKVAGKGLSKNDFTDALKTKLEGLENVELETENIDFYTLDSDEFTYTKTPGTISKFFVHLVTGAENNNWVTRTVESSELGTFIDDGEIERDVYVDADGVKRFDVALYSRKPDDGYDIYIKHSDIDYIAVFDVNITNQSYISDFASAFTNTDNMESLLNAIKKDCDENDATYSIYDGNSGAYVFDKNGLRDENTSPNEDATELDFISALMNYNILDTGNMSSDRYGSKGYRGYNINVIGSGDIDAGIYDQNFGVLELPTYNPTYYSQTIGYYIENGVPDMHTVSQGFKGIPIIEKALEEGRALDLAIFTDHYMRNRD